MNWWKNEIFAAKRHNLETRARLMQAVRGFFERQGFVEVETPALQISPGMETHLHAFRTKQLDASRRQEKDFYLHTSPEFAMKKLLVAGMPRIFQICHVFRNGESSKLHSPEFTMLEWYRADAGYEDIMDDCEALLRFAAKKLKLKTYKHKGRACNPFGRLQRLSVISAFETYAGIDLASVLDDRDAFAKIAGVRVIDTDRWDDIFHAVMADRIEPYLGMDTPCILYDYPLSMAPLSRRTKDGMGERFELYVCGVELANAYGELTDAAEQRERYKQEMKAKQELYGETWPADEDFFKALEHGMPPSGGIALGLDRLAMLAIGVDDIEDILWTGKP
jgi:lysyl-tRNA synthetase class 2